MLEEKKTTRARPRWLGLSMGGPFLGYAIYAAAKGALVLGLKSQNHVIVIRVTEQPLRFWSLVAAMAFAGLVFIIAGFKRQL